MNSGAAEVSSAADPAVTNGTFDINSGEDQNAWYFWIDSEVNPILTFLHNSTRFQEYNSTRFKE